MTLQAINMVGFLLFLFIPYMQPIGKQAMSQSKNHTSSSPSSSRSTKKIENKKQGHFSYRSCPICSKPLLVRIYGCFVYKWLDSHFAQAHHEFMHLVVNLHPSSYR